MVAQEPDSAACYLARLSSLAVASEEVPFAAAAAQSTAYPAAEHIPVGSADHTGSADRKITAAVASADAVAVVGPEAVCRARSYCCEAWVT